MKSFRTTSNPVLAGALLASSVAFAGIQTAQSVFISDTPSGDGTAVGDLGFVHDTPDRIQYIGCYTSVNAVGACFAVDLAGKDRSCYAGSGDMLAQMRSLADDSQLILGWNANGQCTTIGVRTESATAPKK
jgi:hypothetical protein